jgi:hypothetical protein
MADDEMKPTRAKLWVAMACYAVLLVAATVGLDGIMRTALWIFLGGLALKTWIGFHQEEQ